MTKQSKTAVSAAVRQTVEPAKPAPALSVAVDEPNGVLTFTFGNGQSFDVLPDALPDHIKRRATLHGLEQKIRDAAAIGYTQPDGKTRRPTVDEKFKACADVAARLMQGQWNATREGVESGGMMFQAFNAVKPGKFADATAFGDWVQSEATKRDVSKNAIHEALKRDPRIAAELDRIRSARGAVAIDVESLLDGLPD